MDVVGEAVEGVGGFVGMGTVVGALAGLDHHDVLVEGLAVLAAELDADGSGIVGGAAAAVHAGSAVLGPVLLQTGAAGVGELHGLAGLLCSAALLSLLQRGSNNKEMEISQEAEPEGRHFFPLLHMLPSHHESWCLELTFRLEYGDWVQGRTSQMRVSLTSLHSLLLLVTLVEMPVPQLLEHWDQGVVWTMHFWLSNTWTSGCGLNAVIRRRGRGETLES